MAPESKAFFSEDHISRRPLLDRRPTPILLRWITSLQRLHRTSWPSQKIQRDFIIEWDNRINRNFCDHITPRHRHSAFYHSPVISRFCRFIALGNINYQSHPTIHSLYCPIATVRPFTLFPYTYYCIRHGPEYIKMLSVIPVISPPSFIISQAKIMTLSMLILHLASPSTSSSQNDTSLLLKHLKEQKIITVSSDGSVANKSMSTAIRITLNSNLLYASSHIVPGDTIDSFLPELSGVLTTLRLLASLNIPNGLRIHHHLDNKSVITFCSRN